MTELKIVFMVFIILFLAVRALNTTQADIDKCVEHSNYSAERCRVEMTR